MSTLGKAPTAHSPTLFWNLFSKRAPTAVVPVSNAHLTTPPARRARLHYDGNDRRHHSAARGNFFNDHGHAFHQRPARTNGAGSRPARVGIFTLCDWQRHP